MSQHKPESRKPLPAGLPHVAYVLLWYPLFTQPFIFKEVEGLSEFLPLQIYTLYGPNRRHLSREMREHASNPVSFGFKSLLPVTLELFRAFFKDPTRIAKLFQQTCLRRWRSLETFGENLWAFGIGVSLGRKFREEGIDFIYAPWPRGAATAARIAASIAGLPFAIAVRGDNLEPADPDLGDKLRDAIFIRANNAADKKRIQDFGSSQANGKTFLIYNNLSMNLASGLQKRETFHDPLRLLALGRFDVTKGFDVLLKACAILKDKNLAFTLTLAGGGGKVMGLGNEEKKLRELRKTLNLEKEVSMPGLVSHDELASLFHNHDIFAAPCVVHSSGRRDGIPNTVIEAMLWGMPVVGTSVNALPEVIIDNKTGMVVPPNDPVALASAILWLKDHAADALRMGENGSTLVRKMFDVESNSSALAEIFKKEWKCWNKRAAMQSQNNLTRINQDG